MKRFLSIVLAAVLVMALAVPALGESEGAIFGTEITLVENEPTVVYDEWEVPSNVWNPLPADTNLNIGDTVTFVLGYTIPQTVEGYADSLLASIEYITTVNGVDGLEIVEAQGCPPKLECNYDIGICFPVDGYSNVELTENVCTVMASLNTDVLVVFRGTLTEEAVTGTTTVTIGQYHFPAVFSIGTVDKNEENASYNVHRSDFALVQKRAVEFRADAEGTYVSYVGLNDHYYRMVVVDDAIADFIPVDETFADNGEPIDMESELAATLTSIFDEYAEFFNISYGQTTFTDDVFLGDAEHEIFTIDFTLGGDGEPAPTDDPTIPDVPSTGAISLLGIGIVSAISGVAVMFSRKRK